MFLSIGGAMSILYDYIGEAAAMSFYNGNIRVSSVGEFDYRHVNGVSEICVGDTSIIFTDNEDVRISEKADTYIVMKVGNMELEVGDDLFR